MKFSRNFELEVFFAKWEFTAKYNLCGSDIQSMKLKNLLDMADNKMLKKWEDLSLGYTETCGSPDLREKIAGTYKSCKPENILCFAGAEEGIYCAMSALLDSSDHAIVFYPNYQSSETIPMELCDVTGIPLNPDDNWTIDIEYLSSKIQTNTKLISINFPNNPTGKILELSKYNELIELCRKHGIYLFSDEVYRLIERDSDKRLPQAVDVYEKSLSLNVISKAYGFPGLRIGWIACKDKDILLKMERIKHYLSICNSAPSEILTEIVLDNSDKILERNRTLVNSNLILLDKFFEKYNHLFKWEIPDGGCIGFPEYIGEGSTNSFTTELVNKTGILLLPGIFFSSKVGTTPINNFRIGYGRDFLKEALPKLDNYIASII
ncbi:MAG: aminotransferase class I/II-fold pyridoxal phosphate-dependent enzyme [Desulfobacterales bacterium]|nr:aminotransferase class I/II-fold pyridoxal phosphate-dependent enzyme [Desulfobacterales bacterium]MCP4160296.1 aminotransferase class I/II-fold pyridoxal phosphate-dependent enzyme [Deltaproteobacteria bacterium]